MRKAIKNTISVIVLVLLIALAVYYFINNLQGFNDLEFVNPLLIIPLFLIVIVIAVLNGIVIKYLIEPFNIKLAVKEWFGLSVITSFYNTITPFRGGMIAKAAYLKKEHNFSYTNFLASLAGSYVIMFFAASLIGLVSLVLIYLYARIFNYILLLIFLAFFVPLLIIIIFSPKFKETKSNFVNRFIRVMNGWNLIKDNKKVIFILSLISVVTFLLSTIATMFYYNVFGITIMFYSALYLVAIGTLGSLFQITPANLGIAEAIAVFSALVIGIEPTQSIPVAILSRAVSMIVIFILGPIFSYVLMKDTSKKEKSNKRKK